LVDVQITSTTKAKLKAINEIRGANSGVGAKCGAKYDLWIASKTEEAYKKLSC